jgi:hypothetical protein
MRLTPRPIRVNTLGVSMCAVVFIHRLSPSCVAPRYLGAAFCGCSLRGAPSGEDTILEAPTRKGEGCFYIDRLFTQPADSAPGQCAPLAAPEPRLPLPRQLRPPRCRAPTAGPACAFEFVFLTTRRVPRGQELRFTYQAACAPGCEHTASDNCVRFWDCTPQQPRRGR